MSLKEFHLVFITASIFLALGFAYWGFVQYRHFQTGGYAGASLASFLVAACLAAYEMYFIKKNKGVR